MNIKKYNKDDNPFFKLRSFWSGNMKKKHFKTLAEAQRSQHKGIVGYKGHKSGLHTNKYYKKKGKCGKKNCNCS